MIGLLVALAGAVAQEPEQSQPVSGPPLDTGVVERSGISLMLLDVEVTDRKGRPIPGLTLEDFYVQLNGKETPIYSLDDLCSCAIEGEAPPDQMALPEVSSPALALIPDASVFILYIDFSQLRTDGRDAAVEEARRWVRETMQPGDQVQLLGLYAFLQRGLLTWLQKESLRFYFERRQVLMIIWEWYPLLEY